MLRCASSSAGRVRGVALRSRGRYWGAAGLLERHLQTSSGSSINTAKRCLPPVHRRAVSPILCIGGSSTGPFNSVSIQAPSSIHALSLTSGARRQLSARPGGPSLPQKVFAGLVVVVLAAWGLVFGAITLLLLPFVGIGLFLLRRNFQSGGRSRNLFENLARKVAERGRPAGGVGDRGGFGPMTGGGVPWMQRAPTEGVLSSLLTRMLAGGLGGMQLVGVLRSEVEKRALRHPGLSSSLGGGIEAFSDVQMSSVGSVGGTFSNVGGFNSSDDRFGKGPSRAIKARLRFSGRRAGPGGAGWAEVEVTEWEGRGGGDEEGMEFDRIFVTLDNGRSFDLTSDCFAADHRVEEGDGRTAQDFRRAGAQRSSNGSSSSSRAARARGNLRSPGGSRKRGDGRPVEAEFRDK